MASFHFRKEGDELVFADGAIAVDVGLIKDRADLLGRRRRCLLLFCFSAARRRGSTAPPRNPAATPCGPAAIERTSQTAAMNPQASSPNHTRPEPNRRFSVAPMMDWTDRHYRYFARLISRHALLYTEMVTTGAILHGDRARYLGYDVAEQPLALQLGGSNPQELAECAALAEAAGYAEVNLNVGCPSDRVQNNMIGACLMAHPELVADCVRAMRDACAVPVTVKHRIGINGRDSYEQLSDFVSTVHAAGCTSFTVHARIAILEGLSPKENREIPPLKYEVVHQLKQDFPQLEIILNGGLTDLAVMQAELAHVDGVMVDAASIRLSQSLLEQADLLGL